MGYYPVSFDQFVDPPPHDSLPAGYSSAINTSVVEKKKKKKKNPSADRSGLHAADGNFLFFLFFSFTDLLSWTRWWDLGIPIYSKLYLMGLCFQALSRAFLNELIVAQLTTSVGRLFQGFMTLCEKELSLIFVFDLGLSNL